MLAEVIIALIVLGFSGYLFYETIGFPKSSIASIGPEYWPQIILGSMFILGIILLVNLYRNRENFTDNEKIQLPNKQNLWITVVLTLIYTWILPILGYPISTLIFVTAMLWILKIRKVKWLSIYSLSFTVVIVVLFPKLMGIPLPRGMGIFRSISLFFY